MDRNRVLKDFQHMCSIYSFPLEVDPQAWSIRPTRDNKWKEWVCKVSYALYIAHVLYKIFRLINIFLFLRGTPLHQIIIHAVLAVSGIMFAFWHHWLYYKHVDVNAAYMTMTLTGNAAGGTEEKKLKRKHRQILVLEAPPNIILNTGRIILPVHENEDQRLFRRLSKYSLQDLIAIFMPYVVFSGVLLILACFIHDPTMQLLLYSALPDRQKNWMSFLFCFAEEMRFLLMAVGSAVPAWQVQVIAFNLINKNLQLLLESLSTET